MSAQRVYEWMVKRKTPGHTVRFWIAHAVISNADAAEAAANRAMSLLEMVETETTTEQKAGMLIECSGSFNAVEVIRDSDGFGMVAYRDWP